MANQKIKKTKKVKTQLIQPKPKAQKQQIKKNKIKNRRAPRRAIILFADVIGSSELSNVLSFEEYDDLLKEFQETMSRVIQKQIMSITYHKDNKRRFEASVRGDEVCLILYSNVEHEEIKKYIELDIRLALLVAIEMKRQWLTSRVNSLRIKGGRNIIDIGIGLNCGHVMIGPHKMIKDGSILEVNNPEGYAINLAKRIEGYSRVGEFSKIFVSRNIFNPSRVKFQIAFSKVHMAEFKGIAQTVPVYEIKSVGHVEDTGFSPHLSDDNEVETFESAVELNPHNLWLILDLAHYYFDKEKYSEAVKMYLLAIEVAPDFTPAHMYLGRSYFRDSFDYQALPHLERARELNPDSARANNFFAVCLRRIASRKKNEKDVGKNSEEWKSFYLKALDLHKVAMRIVDEEPKRYQWAFNAYAMTLAQATQAKTFGEADKDVNLRIAKKKIDAVIKSRKENVNNHLFSHTKGFIYGTEGNLKEAEKCFTKALNNLESQKTNDVQKYREKKSEILFHLGLLGVKPSTKQYQMALCEAYAGDFLRGRTPNTCAENAKLLKKHKEKEARIKFVERQYWYSEISEKLSLNQIKVGDLLKHCETCVLRGINCSPSNKCI